MIQTIHDFMLDKLYIFFVHCLYIYIYVGTIHRNIQQPVALHIKSIQQSHKNSVFIVVAQQIYIGDP